MSDRVHMVGHGGSSADSYLADPTSPIPSHCTVIILLKSVPVHQCIIVTSTLRINQVSDKVYIHAPIKATRLNMHYIITQSHAMMYNVN